MSMILAKGPALAPTVVGGLLVIAAGVLTWCLQLYAGRRARREYLQDEARRRAEAIEDDERRHQAELERDQAVWLRDNLVSAGTEVVRTAGALVDDLARVLSGVVPAEEMAPFRHRMMGTSSDLDAAIGAFQLVDPELGMTLNRMRDALKACSIAAVGNTPAERAEGEAPLEIGQVIRNNWLLQVADRVRGGDADLERVIAEFEAKRPQP